MALKKSLVVKTKGFTLVEILLVIGIIAVLATVVIVSLDPATRFQNARDARRLSDIQSILSAVQQYIVDNRGALPNGLDTEWRQIGTGGGGCLFITPRCNISPDACLDLSTPLSRYLKSMPYDPAFGSATMTHYAISVDANNLVTVIACDSTDDSISSVSR